MELKIYYTYADFINNYEDQLNNWLEFFPDAKEEDFREDVKKKYVEYKPSFGELRGYVELISDEGIERISLHHLAKLIERRVDFSFEHYNNLELNLANYALAAQDFRIYNSFDDEPPALVDRYEIPYTLFLKYKDFLKFSHSKTSDGDIYRIDFDMIKYKNFGYAIDRIMEFLNDQPANAPRIRDEVQKIKINGNTQLVGYIFSQLIEGCYIEPITTKTTENINQTATAQMLLDHFEFTEKEDQPTTEYFKKAVFDNSFSQSKSERIKIPPRRIFD